MRRKSLLTQIIEIVYALIVTYAVGKWAIHFAYQERGYDAVGGEYLFILAAYWVAYKTIHYLFDVLEEETYGKRVHKKRRSREIAEVRDYR